MTVYHIVYRIPSLPLRPGYHVFPSWPEFPTMHLQPSLPCLPIPEGLPPVFPIIPGGSATPCIPCCPGLRVPWHHPFPFIPYSRKRLTPRPPPLPQDPLCSNTIFLALKEAYIKIYYLRVHPSGMYNGGNLSLCDSSPRTTGNYNLFYCFSLYVP